MHLLRDQKAPPRCEVGGEKSRADDAREDCRNIKQKECKHVELGGLAQRAIGFGDGPGPTRCFPCRGMARDSCRELPVPGALPAACAQGSSGGSEPPGLAELSLPWHGGHTSIPRSLATHSTA